MGKLFGGGKSSPKPKVPPPQPIPVVGPDLEDTVAKTAGRRRGFKQAIITGDLAPTTNKRSTLG